MAALIAALIIVALFLLCVVDFQIDETGRRRLTRRKLFKRGFLSFAGKILDAIVSGT